MKRGPILILLAWLLTLLSPLSLRAQGPSTRPVVWMGTPSHSDGRCFRELFEHPDQWKETRAAIDGLVYADHWLHKQFKDEELRAWFAQINQWGLKFELEVGAIKPWGITGEKTFGVQQPMWDRFLRLGARIDSIAMDEPLSCCRQHIHKPDDYALEETANFIALVRKRYPQVQLGDIETYPTIPLADHYTWIEALQKRLAEKGVRGLDFYRLDVNWAVFTAFNQGSWLEVRELERYCRKRKLPFGLCYWASEIGPMQKRGLADDSTWYVNMMQQGYDYTLIQGLPDQYVLQSWSPYPLHSVPETDPWTFTRSVLDFSKRFIKRKP